MAPRNLYSLRDNLNQTCLTHHSKFSPPNMCGDFKGHKKVTLNTHIHVHTLTCTHVHKHTHTCSSISFVILLLHQGFSSFPVSFNIFSMNLCWCFLIITCQLPVASPRGFTSGNVQHSNIERVVQLVDRACLSRMSQASCHKKNHLPLQDFLQPKVTSLPRPPSADSPLPLTVCFCHNSGFFLYQQLP